MDEILERTIQLGCLIRDSPEGNSWRESREKLDKIPLKTLSSDLLTSDKVPMDENLGLIHRANKVRPLLLPLLVNKYSPNISNDEIRRELSKYQKIWDSYHQLELCTAFTAIMVTFLRKIAPGYPHKGIIYTLPNARWREISSEKELPWDMASSLIPENATDARQIGLERVIPTSWPIISVAINLLVETIMQGPTWIELDKAYKVIERNSNLKRELYRAAEQFAKEFAPYQDRSISKPTQFAKFEDLASQVYEKRGERILNYVNKFLEYEWLVERIYWLLSQIIIFEQISCITSSNPNEIQQVLLNYGKEAYMTALAKTRGKTFAIGQLVHVTLPETDNISDGLYQINSLQQKYDAESGVHILFRSRNLWYCKLEALLSVTEQYKQPTCLQNEMLDMVEGTIIEILDGENVVGTWGLGELRYSKMGETMYLP